MWLVASIHLSVPVYKGVLIDAPKVITYRHNLTSISAEGKIWTLASIQVFFIWYTNNKYLKTRMFFYDTAHKWQRSGIENV